MSEETEMLTAGQTGHSAWPIGQQVSTVYRWDDTRLVSDAPALVRLPTGRLLCSVQLWSRDDTAARLYGRGCCLVFASEDDGLSWREQARLPFLTGKFLSHDGTLYFLGAGLGRQGLWITRSGDAGRNWSKPVCLLKGGVYAASTGWVQKAGHLYWAADNNHPSVRGRKVFVMAANLVQDLLDPGTWRFSIAIAHPGVPQVFGRGEHNGGKWLEPNVVSFGGQLRLVVRVRVSQDQVDGVVPNVAAVCDLADDGETLSLGFSHYYPVPGAQNHFHIVYDAQSRLNWMTSNLVTGIAEDLWRGWGKERRFLMLHYSVDGLNWFSAGCLATAPGVRQAFNYCTPLIDGEDLLVVSRTALEAANQHDNDRITFHRVAAFRRLAMNLFPHRQSG